MTPKGRVIELPNGSTPLDFAYRVHTEVGHTAVGAIVNGALVPLNTVLKTGDVVNIRTNKNTGPSEDWLKIVKSATARNKIKSYLMKKKQKPELRPLKKVKNCLLKNLKREILMKNCILIKTDWNPFIGNSPAITTVSLCMQSETSRFPCSRL